MTNILSAYSREKAKWVYMILAESWPQQVGRPTLFNAHSSAKKFHKQNYVSCFLTTFPTSLTNVYVNVVQTCNSRGNVVGFQLFPGEGLSYLRGKFQGVVQLDRADATVHGVQTANVAVGIVNGPVHAPPAYFGWLVHLHHRARLDGLRGDFGRRLIALCLDGLRGDFGRRLIALVWTGFLVSLVGRGGN